ncbi:MAG: MarR family transcriptional regulator [Planctomycetes bacterium]|nr:MarR family transcriptional regulator [Planctomycetota bacterium]
MSTTHFPHRGVADPAAVLFGLTRRRVLGWLLSHPDGDFHFREIVRRTGSAHGAVQRELTALAAAGLVRRTVRGRQVFFQAERASPIFAELSSIFLKTAGIADVIRDALTPLSRRILAAFVFGSAVRGELGRSSDIDVLVLGDVSFLEVADALASAQPRLGREVNPTVYPTAEFRDKLRTGHHFLKSVLAGPRVFVIGDPGELAGLGTERVGHGARHKSGRNPRSARGDRAEPRRSTPRRRQCMAEGCAPGVAQTPLKSALP